MVTSKFPDIALCFIIAPMEYTLYRYNFLFILIITIRINNSFLSRMPELSPRYNFQSCYWSVRFSFPPSRGSQWMLCRNLLPCQNIAYLFQIVNTFSLQLKADEDEKDRLLGIDTNFHCSGNGNWPHPTQCRLFYTCDNQSAIKRAHLWQCKKGYFYDTKYQRCRYSKVTDCGDRIW
jgi:hypothetical protein